MARRLSDASGRTVKRNLTEVREGSCGDLVSELPILVECKCGKKPRWKQAYREAHEAAEGTGKYAIAVTKRDGAGARPARETVHMSLEDFLELVEALVGGGMW